MTTFQALSIAVVFVGVWVYLWAKAENNRDAIESLEVEIEGMRIMARTHWQRTTKLTAFGCEMDHRLSQLEHGEEKPNG